MGKSEKLVPVSEIKEFLEPITESGSGIKSKKLFLPRNLLSSEGESLYNQIQKLKKELMFYSDNLAVFSQELNKLQKEQSSLVMQVPEDFDDIESRELRAFQERLGEVEVKIEGIRSKISEYEVLRQEVEKRLLEAKAEFHEHFIILYELESEV
jgi:chromosome segregation ATPase